MVKYLQMSILCLRVFAPPVVFAVGEGNSYYSCLFSSAADYRGGGGQPSLLHLPSWLWSQSE